MENFLKEYGLMILPLLLIYFGVIIFCIVDLFKTERPIRGPKFLWLLVLLFVNPFGLIAYLLLAKGE